MNRMELIASIRSKKSFLSVGLDPDMSKIPAHLLDCEDPFFEFAKEIIDHTKDLCVAYKPNLAFYERIGSSGLESLKRTIAYIGSEHLIIADAKRGDIGNTSKYYSDASFDDLQANAITVAPYMGEDSVKPFMRNGKWVVLLALTSNPGASDFQFHGEPPLYQVVLKKSQEWGTPDNLMYVVGATRPEYFREVRNIAPDHFLLVPGVGAQGGDLAAVCEMGMNQDIGLLINSSRGIIYASNGKDFGHAARESALKIQRQMEAILDQ